MLPGRKVDDWIGRLSTPKSDDTAGANDVSFTDSQGKTERWMTGEIRRRVAGRLLRVKD